MCVMHRACEGMLERRADDMRKFGVIALLTIHQYMYFHVNLSEHLFGSGMSTNTAHYFTRVLTCRPRGSPAESTTRTRSMGSG